MGEINPYQRCLLITGTIVPNSNFVVHADINKRRSEYYNNLIYYSDIFSGEPIYFLENSAYDFSKDNEFELMLKNKNITLLKFSVSDKYNEGKGYQEFEMIDKAIEKIKNNHNAFIKITGRYKVTNLKKICDLECKTAIIDCHKKIKIAQTNVFYMNFDFYLKNLKGIFAFVNDSNGIFIEKIMYKTLASRNLIKKINMFSSPPVITGISGSYGGTLNRNKYKMILKRIERKIYKIAGVKQLLIEY